MEMPFKDDSEILDLVHRFESGELNPADFRHYQHLTVALWYLRQFPCEVASEKIRTGIKKLAAAYGKTGYHETITLFWLRIVSNFAAADDTSPLWALANMLVAAHHDKNLLKHYYSEELIASAEAKRVWVSPDLKSL